LEKSFEETFLSKVKSGVAIPLGKEPTQKHVSGGHELPLFEVEAIFIKNSRKPSG
jgi:hypothetical protein